MTIRRITSARDKKAFIRLLWDIYKNDPHWIPPLEMDRLKLINDRKNPFYKHAETAFFLAEEGGRIVGRIAAIVDNHHNQFHNEKTAFFGFFESVNDRSVSDALFKEAEDFARSRGMNRIRGPYNPSSNDEAGLLIDGFDSPPVILMTYNPKYYIQLFETAGYWKVMDMFAWKLTPDTARSTKLLRVTEALRKRDHITIRPFDPKKFRAEVDRIKRLYNSAWEKNWGFVPLTDEEFEFLAADLKQIYDPGLIFFAEVGGETVGFSLTLPNINDAFHAGVPIPRGVLNLPIALWKLLTNKKRIKSCRILPLGVTKEHRGRAIDAMLYSATIRAAEERGYTYGEASWILENNDPMNRALAMMNGERYKTYRIYEKEI